MKHGWIYLAVYFAAGLICLRWWHGLMQFTKPQRRIDAQFFYPHKPQPSDGQPLGSLRYNPPTSGTETIQ